MLSPSRLQTCPHPEFHSGPRTSNGDLVRSKGANAISCLLRKTPLNMAIYPDSADGEVVPPLCFACCVGRVVPALYDYGLCRGPGSPARKNGVSNGCSVCQLIILAGSDSPACGQQTIANPDHLWLAEIFYGRLDIGGGCLR